MVRLMDCTLRDGANVVGKGFDAEITKIVLDILTESNVLMREEQLSDWKQPGHRRRQKDQAQAESELMRLRDSQTP